MRIAVVHGYYRSDVPSGENIVVDAQVAALRAAGHSVTLVAQRSDDRMRRPTWPLEAAGTTVTGIGPDPTAALRRAAPDVVHVHNLFPHFGTRWLDAWPGPLVATLHNFRPMCAIGTLFRDGRRCTECRDGAPLAAVRHGCLHSKAASVPLALAQLRTGPVGHPVVRRADRLVAISLRAVDEYALAGVPPGRIDVVANAVAPAPPRSPAAPRPAGERWLVTGRLSREKGVHELLAAWPAGRPLDVVGDGECADELRALAGPDVRFLGRLDNAEVRSMVADYTGLLVPSQWPEAGPPLTYLEALAAGTPTVAFANNGAADDVAQRGTGVVVGQVPGTAELATALDRVRDERAALSQVCRRVFDTRYGLPTWTAAIERVYRAAIAARGTVAGHATHDTAPRDTAVAAVH